ncbi:MAG: uroporphyrinogen-III synthase [Bacillota bacterium]|nr:uroporphyrinogen-III synthase [Bacillota bacterium]
MGNGLEGKRIALGGSRKIEEISLLIEKQGGVPMVRSLQGITFLAEKEVEPDLLEFVNEGSDWVIFTTGIGLETLVNLAEKLEVKEQFLSVIRRANVASRGYKTLAALKKLNIQPVVVDEDGTTKGLSRALESMDFTGKRVMIQLHGETAPALTKFFEDRGAKVTKILPYQHIAPETETVTKLCDEMIGHEIDAVCFTTAVQVRSLFDFARKTGFFNNVLNCFRQNVTAAAVGKVTAEALKEEGVERIITPEIERMGAMIIELSNYYRKKNVK